MRRGAPARPHAGAVVHLAPARPRAYLADVIRRIVNGHPQSRLDTAALADLPAETRAQIAHVLAALLRRMQAHMTASEESRRADRLERS